MLQLTATTAAGCAGTPIDVEALGEVAGFAGAADEVAQGGAALGDGRGQHLLGGGGQAIVALASDATGSAARIDTGQKQRFAGVDIAHPDDHGVVHQERFHRRLAPPRQGVQPGAVEGLRQRLGA